MVKVFQLKHFTRSYKRSFVRDCRLYDDYITSARTFLSPFGASGRLHLKMNAGNLLLNLELQIGQKFADSSGAYITHLQKQANFNYTIQNINVKVIIREEYTIYCILVNLENLWRHRYTG